MIFLDSNLSAQAYKRYMLLKTLPFWPLPVLLVNNLVQEKRVIFRSRHASIIEPCQRRAGLGMEKDKRKMEKKWVWKVMIFFPKHQLAWYFSEVAHTHKHTHTCARTLLLHTHTRARTNARMRTHSHTRIHWLWTGCH